MAKHRAMHNSLSLIMDLQVVHNSQVLFHLSSCFSIHLVYLMSMRRCVPKLRFKTPLWSRSYKHFIKNSNRQTYIKHSVAATRKVITEKYTPSTLIFNGIIQNVLLIVISYSVISIKRIPFT